MEPIIKNIKDSEEIDFTKVSIEDESDMDNIYEQKILDIKSLFINNVIERVNNKMILDYDKMILECPEIDEYLIHNPLETVDLIKSEIIYKYGKKYPLRFKNLEYAEEISNIRVEHIGKIVKVSGMLSNASIIVAKTINTKWECPSCGVIIAISSAESPSRCSCGRRGGFKLIEKNREDSQDIVIEENQDSIGDRSPKRVRIRLSDDLCDKEMNGIVKDGNKIEVIGVVEAIPMKKDNHTKEELSYFRLHALQVISLEDEFDNIITDEDEIEILEISANNPLKQLSDSINPGIIGRDMEKKALILSVIGAYPKMTKKGLDRGRISIMMIGDASTGKSQLMQALGKKHYKAIYRACERMTEAGLVGGGEKDELTGIWSLRAGLLPKANKGLALLDELDKMPRGVQKLLHTPMESGFCSINLIGNSVNLNSDCTIIVGANPKNSRFDQSKPLPPQINMSDTLISRFTLIIAMRDKIEEESDRGMVESIWEDNIKEDDMSEYISDDMFRKYIKYSQQFNPKPTDKAKKIINDFYVEVRQKTQVMKDGGEAIPIVMRQAIGLKKLAEANARCRLSNELTEEDANSAIDLYRYSLKQLGMNTDKTGYDFAHIGPGVTLKIKEKRMIILEFIKSMDNEKGFVTDDELIEFTKDKGIFKLELDKLLEDIKREGFIFSPRYGQWKYLG